MRSMFRAANFAFTFAALSAFAFACGSSTNGTNTFGDQTFGTGSGSKADGGSGTTAGDDDSTGSGSLVGDGSAGSGNATDGGTTVTTTAMCNSVSAVAQQSPLNLVIMIDKSGSMGSPDNCAADADNCLAKKWTPVTTAIETFLEDPSSTNMSAAMQFFPYDGSGSNQDCSATTYGDVAVDFTALPVAAASDPFKTAIKAVSPDGDTPTLQALTGAITYAQTAMAADTTGAKYAILFVTDGDPCGCGTSNNGCPGGNGNDSSDVTKVANEAASAAATIPTYVIGVGQEGNLDKIAAGGGTTKAFLATVGTPAQTEMDLQTAMAAIRKSEATCNFQIPAPPSGQSYDINAVNVQYTPSGGSAQTLPYDPACTGAGWHYDDATNPTQILLCGTSCAEVKAGTGGAVNVEFGCETVGGIPGYDGGVMIR